MNATLLPITALHDNGVGGVDDGAMMYYCWLSDDHHEPVDASNTNLGCDVPSITVQYMYSE